MIDTRLPQDADWYQKQGERLRQKAMAVKSDDALRNSYVALAAEYERLAVTLKKRNPNVLSALNAE